MITIRSRLLSLLAGFILVVIIISSGQIEGGGTPTPTPSPEIFEYPDTPPLEDVLPVVLDLLEAVEDCLLPCFWGFHLGENTTEETTKFVIDNFHQIPHVILDSEIEDPNNLFDPSARGIDFYATFLPLSGGQLQVSFGSIDGVLVRIDIKLFMAIKWLEGNPFLLSEVLNTYGEPTQVYLRYSGAPTIASILAVVYEDQGFIVEYGFGNNVSANERLMNERITEDGRLMICAEDPTFDSIQLTLQSDDSPSTLREALSPSLDDPTAFRPPPFDHFGILKT